MRLLPYWEMVQNGTQKRTAIVTALCRERKSIMVGLSRYEREVTIGFNAAEGTAELYTADPVWMRKLDKLVERNPEQFKLGGVETCKGEAVAKRYSFPKRFITIRSKDVKREMTDEQTAELAERLGKAR